MKYLATAISITLTLTLGILGNDSKSIAQAGTLTHQAGTPAQHEFDIRFLREEEKLARDIYLTLYERWNLRIFKNISESEQRHMDRMATLIDRYGLQDPVTDDRVGAFTNPELEALYAELVERGSGSEISALVVGANIEDLDIRDIRKMRENTTDPNTLATFAKLECGSRNHMRAFTSQLATRGVPYEAMFLDETAVAEILSGESERCGQRQGTGRNQAHKN